MECRKNAISVPNYNSEKERQSMNITYEKNGDYLIPNLIPNPEPEGELRKFGLMRKHYLKERHLSDDAFKRKTKGTFAYDAGTGRDTV